jgi:hypothetical protein
MTDTTHLNSLIPYFSLLAWNIIYNWPYQVYKSVESKMINRFWVRLLSLRKKSKAESQSAELKFEPQLTITREDTWTYVILKLVNHSGWTVWVEEAVVELADFDTEWQNEVPAGQFKPQILQNVGPNETLSVSLASTIYDAAGRPQGQCSSLISTNVRHIFDKWYDARLETCRVRMAALTAVDLDREHWYNRKIKQIKRRGDLATKEHMG